MQSFTGKLCALVLATSMSIGTAAAQDDPNLLMGKAIELYSSAVSASDEDRRALFLEVDEILKRIETEFTDSVPGTFMKEGRPLGPIDRSVIAAELAPPPYSLTDRLTGKLAEHWQFLKERSPDVANTVETTLSDVMGAAPDAVKEELYVKATYYAIASSYYVSNTPIGKYFDPTEAATLYKGFVTGRGLESAGDIGLQSIEDIAVSVALDFVSGTIADKALALGPDLSPTTKNIARAAIKSSITEVTLAFQASQDPSKVPGLLFKRVADLIEIVVTTKGLAADVDRALAATAMSMQTLAQITALYSDQDGTRRAIASTIDTLEDSMVDAVGRDDAEDVATIFLNGWAGLTAEFRGDFAKAKLNHDMIKERGDLNNTPTLWNAPDLLTYFANGFTDSPKRAAEIMIGLTELSKYSRSDEMAAAEASPSAAPPQPSAPGSVYEPSRDDPARIEILNAVRVLAERDLGAPVQFVVETMRATNDRAYVEFWAQRPGGGQIDLARDYRGNWSPNDPNDPRWISGFLRKEGSAWNAYDIVFGATEAWWVDNCAGLETLMPNTCGAATATAPQAAPATTAQTESVATGPFVNPEFYYVQTDSAPDINTAVSIASGYAKAGLPHVNVFKATNRRYEVVVARLDRQQDMQSAMESFVAQHALNRVTFYTSGETYLELVASYEGHAARPEPLIVEAASAPSASAASAGRSQYTIDRSVLDKIEQCTGNTRPHLRIACLNKQSF